MVKALDSGMSSGAAYQQWHDSARLAFYLVHVVLILSSVCQLDDHDVQCRADDCVATLAWTSLEHLQAW